MNNSKELKLSAKASLWAEYSADATPETEVFFYRNSAVPKDNWQLSFEQVYEVLETRNVSAVDHSALKGYGLFRIGKHYNWLYDLSFFSSTDDLTNKIYQVLVYSISASSLLVELLIKNKTKQALTKAVCIEPCPFYEEFPEVIKSNDFKRVILTNKKDIDKAIETSVAYEGSLGSIAININKNFDKYASEVTSDIKDNLIDQVKTKYNNFIELNAEVVIAENPVFIQSYNFYNFLKEIEGKFKSDNVIVEGANLYDNVNYSNASQIFNTRLKFKPLAIIKCTSTDEVKLAYKSAINNNLPIRVRSGGHDHEGECTGTDVILIDLSKMNKVTVDPETLIATIGPGNRFETLTTRLAENVPTPVMIPHGTCATVGIAGFTFGGGWGPWTRAKGMCCEYLVGATIVLGNGKQIEVSENGDEQSKKLLWALRGGGGFSYGIVTELQIQTFELPVELIKFEVEWNKYEVDKENGGLKIEKGLLTIDVLSQWETVIEDTKQELSEQLIGTNLKISAIPGPEKDEDFKVDKVYHNCVMYGYWEGDEKSLQTFIEQSYGAKGNYEVRIVGFGGSGSVEAYGSNMMSAWDRESLYNVRQLLQDKLQLGKDAGSPLPPDNDEPAPHKLTSRLVNSGGLKKEGASAFLRTLTSPLVYEGNREKGLFSYVTLGAITGAFYQNEQEVEKLNSAFPYKDRMYTIQYQCWWNEELSNKLEQQNNEVYDQTNRGMDWIQAGRSAVIPNTAGAFISFKDSSIPTETYFGDSYGELKRIKENYSEDPYNHFRTRKTII